DPMRGRGVPMAWRAVRTGSRRGSARGDLAAASQATLGIAGAVVLLLSGCNAADERPATWEYLSPVVFEPTCATGSCHGPASAVGTGTARPRMAGRLRQPTAARMRCRTQAPLRTRGFPPTPREGTDAWALPGGRVSPVSGDVVRRLSLVARRPGATDLGRRG